MAFKDKHPDIDTPEKYADFMMREQAKFNAKGQEVKPPPTGVANPAAVTTTTIPPSNEAVNLLKSNPSAAQQANFDAIFGSGAAKRALAQQ
jgi:hypothetical protein